MQVYQTTGGLQMTNFCICLRTMKPAFEAATLNPPVVFDEYMHSSNDAEWTVGLTSVIDSEVL